MPIRKKGDVEIQTSPRGVQVKQTGYTFYSYDKNAAALYFQFREQDGQPTDLAKATVHLVMILNDDNGKKFIPGDDEIEVISAIRGTAKYVLPEMLLSYSGKVTGYVYMDFDDGSQSDDGQFTFRIKHSMITHVLPKAGDKYVQDFEDVKERVEQAGDSATKDIEKAKDNAESQIGDYVGEVESAKSDIDSSVSDVQSKASEASEDISGLVKTTEDARDNAVKSMNELDYSDRNLLVSSNLMSYDSYNDTPVVEENGRKITTKYVTDQTNTVTLKDRNLDPCGKYTISGRIEINGKPITKETISSQVINTNHDRSKNERLEVLSDGSFVATETYDSEADYWIIKTSFDGIKPGDVITFYDLQFQPGSVATPWQPAFGDYDAKIKKLEEAITNLGGSV